MSQLARSAIQLGAIIRRKRRDLGWTQQQLAERLDLRQATISGIEAGVPGARLSTIQSILAALGLELNVADRNRSQPGIGDIF